MSISIYVGNLSFGMDEEALKTVFEAYGEVKSSKVISDRDTGRSKGFGFIEMEKEAGEKAISELDGKEVSGRNIKVTIALPKKPREDRGFQKRDSFNSPNFKY